MPIFFFALTSITSSETYEFNISDQKMEKKSWVCTVIIQFALCVALYCAINLGEPQTPTYRTGIHRQPNQIYFISVRGGFRPLKHQTRLLKQIEKVMYAYNVGFVINISELGEDDPLLQNDASSGIEELQLKQLSRKLELSNSNWRIAAVFHPLFCNQSFQQTQAKRNDFLHQMLLKHGVDAYISGQSCDNEARIGVGGPYLTTISQGSYPPKEMVNMFLLHRVSPLEITTYGVGFKGDIIDESTVWQKGREAM
ncbi:hypothetical protein L1987_21031 [Smallanthus sonchifolius]|uniref:Uncharacterized protein n=1 Tax=Smallanthus sonchifolius TaxID=185202 RepID=A0ACB9IVB2_9ASTR|nr:hypothetical protein L1987_21031 [Smallanthus sonchifolius]